MKMGVAIAALAALAGLASATPIVINEAAVGGGTYTLRAGDLSATVFNASSPNLTNSALGSIHAALAADGVDTDNIVTIIAAATDDGLGLFALIDKEIGGFKNHTNRLDLVVVAKDENSNGIQGWVNDNGGELVQTANSNPIVGTYTYNTTFQWDETTRGDAFALSQLDLRDNGSMVFNTLPQFGTSGVARGFQYVSYNNGTWVVVGTGGFNPNGSSTSLDWRVIPLPHAGAMSLAGLALVGGRRRRSL